VSPDLRGRAARTIPSSPPVSGALMKRFLFLLAASCGGDPFVLEPPDTGSPKVDDVISQEAATTEAADDVRDLLDAGGWDSDSGSDTEVGVDGGETARGGPAETSAPEAAQGCPPPVAPDGFSNVCASVPMRGASYISTFPAECACDYTCACLMKSSICYSAGGHPQSCQWVNGSVCNSIVLAAVVCN
jgi:hypothetical protein